MERRKIFVLVIVILVNLFLPGCGKSSENTYSEVTPGAGTSTSTPAQQNTPDSDKNSSEKDSVDKNDSSTGGKEEDTPESRGVVVDTVVDVFREPDIKSERVTQAIFNQPVEILEEKDSWMKVNVVDGYTGWVKSKLIDRDCTSIEASHYSFKVVIILKDKEISSQLKGGLTLKKVVMGTELFAKGKVGSMYEVALPGNITGWVNENGTIRLETNESIHSTSAQDFVATVTKFKGTSYLWGGVSSLGVDCSGLTYISSRINGVVLPRDASPQYKADIGIMVEPDAIMPGDLVFFSTNEDLKDISHVAVYLGEDNMIHAAKGKGYVIVSPFSQEYYQKRLVGVKRIF